MYAPVIMTGSGTDRWNLLSIKVRPEARTQLEQPGPRVNHPESDPCVLDGSGAIEPDRRIHDK
jgi:hypothetical protein